MTMPLLMTALVGALLAFDRITLQFMLSRPIISAPLAGLLLGNPSTGLFVGALLELFWIEGYPEERPPPPDHFPAALLIASSSILAGTHLGRVSQEIVAFSLLLFIPFGYLSAKMEERIMRSNDRLQEQAIQEAKKGKEKAIVRGHLTGMATVCIFYFLFTLLSLSFGTFLIIRLFPLIPRAGLQALAMTCLVLPLLGIASGLRTLQGKRIIPLFCIVFLAWSFILEVIRLFGT